MEITTTAALLKNRTWFEEANNTQTIHQLAFFVNWVHQSGIIKNFTAVDLINLKMTLKTCLKTVDVGIANI